MQIQIDFGAMAPKIAEQIAAAKLTADKDGIAHCQKDADALTRLAVRGLLPDSAIRNGRKKLMKHIIRYVKPNAPLGRRGFGYQTKSAISNQRKGDSHENFQM